ncbi:hypothetical protein BH23CHL7_BH23CHL7_19250 [soil metagenome]
MTVRREWLNWGIFLIALGVVPLAVYWNLVDPAVTQDLIRLWPLILIGIGVGLLLRFTPLAAVGRIFTAAVFGLLLGAVIAGGWSAFGGDGICRTDSSLPHETRSGSFSGQAARLDIELNCGTVHVARQPGSDWSVATQIGGEGNPVIEGSADRLRLDKGEGRFAGIRRDWTVSLPQDQALTANITLNAGSGRFDLGAGAVDSVNGTFNAADAQLLLDGATRLGSVNLTYNATSGTLRLPAQAGIANVTLNAASLALCVPPGVGLQIDYQSTLSSHNFESQGLTSSGDRQWSVGGSPQILLNINANVSSVTLDRSGGCP